MSLLLLDIGRFIRLLDHVWGGGMDSARQTPAGREIAPSLNARLIPGVPHGGMPSNCQHCAGLAGGGAMLEYQGITVV